MKWSFDGILWFLGGHNHTENQTHRTSIRKLFGGFDVLLPENA